MDTRAPNQNMTQQSTTTEIYEEKRLKYRDLWPVLKTETYLNHAAHSPLSNATVEAMNRFMKSLNQVPMAPFEEWFNEFTRSRELMAKFVNATPEEIFFNFNTSLSLSMLTGVIPWERGDNIIVPDRCFPAVVMPAKILVQWGMEARKVDCIDDLIDEDSLIGAIDDRTKMMIVPMVNFLTGQRLDIPKLAAACGKSGVFLTVDAIQAAGPIKIDVNSLGCHALCFGSPKWMFGPMGVGTCYIQRDMIRKMLVPQVGMLSVKDPWNFFDYDQELIDTAQVYECGCMNYLAHYGINPTVEMFLDLGQENIEHHLLTITGEFHDKLTSNGVKVLTPREDTRRAAIVTFDARSAGWESAEALMAALNEKLIRVSVRMELLRISPHFYNTSDELDKVLEITLSGNRTRSVSDGTK